MKKSFLLCCILFMFRVCICQNADTTKITDSKIFAHQQVETLKKQGAVIVLLKGTSRAMEAYQKAGNTKVVDEMRKKNKKLNRQLVRAFSHQWHFCPVYFMFNDDIATLQNDVKASVFVDSTFNRLPGVSMKEAYFVFMDFGTFYVPSNNTGDNQPSKWKNNETMSDPVQSNQVVEECLIVKDRDLRQFIPPYPNRSASIMGSRDLENMVASLNKRFSTFLTEK